MFRVEACNYIYNLLFRICPIQFLRYPIHSDTPDREDVELYLLVSFDIITIQRGIISYYVQHVLVPANVNDVEFAFGFVETGFVNERIYIFACNVAPQEPLVRRPQDRRVRTAPINV